MAIFNLEYCISNILQESSYKSKLDVNNKKKELIKLSDLELRTRHRNDEGKSIVLSWYDNNVFVAMILIDTIPASDGYKWFGSFRISKKYRNHGLSEQILKLATSDKYKAGALAVNKDNEIAIHVYKKIGFEISKTRTDKEYYYMYLHKNKIKE